MVQDRAILTMADRIMIKCRHIQWPWTTFVSISRSRHYLMLNTSETVRDIDIVSMEY